MKKETEKVRMFPPGSGIGIGIALGAGIGIAMDNLVMGIAIGIAIGAGIDGAAYAVSDRSKDDN